MLRSDTTHPHPQQHSDMSSTTRVPGATVSSKLPAGGSWGMFAGARLAQLHIDSCCWSWSWATRLHSTWGCRRPWALGMRNCAQNASVRPQHIKTHHGITHARCTDGCRSWPQVLPAGVVAVLQYAWTLPAQVDRQRTRQAVARSGEKHTRREKCTRQQVYNQP